MAERCTYHEFTEADMARDYSPLIGSGPQCPNVATHVSCDPTGALHCAQHKCRCAKTIEQAAKDALDARARRAKRLLGEWLYEGHSRGERRTFEVNPTLCESPDEAFVCYLYRDRNREHLANGTGATPVDAQLAALEGYQAERAPKEAADG